MGVEQILPNIIGFFIGFLRVLYWYAEALFRQFVPPPMKSIDGEAILVTGATGGIGREICRNLVKSGKDIKLVLWDLDQATLTDFAHELKSIGAPGLTVYPCAIDISSRENIDAGCQQVRDAVGNVSIIFNNAGVGTMGNFLQYTNESIESMINVNLMSHFWVIRQFLPDMVANNHGRIINTCSIGGLKSSPLTVPYCTTKFAVNGYTEGLKAELRLQKYQYDGIKFTTVYPWFVRTPLIKSLDVNTKSDTTLPFGLNKFLTAEEVGKKMVDGMRREYEYIYLPSTIPLMLFLEYLTPLKVRQALEANVNISKNLVFKDPTENAYMLNTPYLPSAPVHETTL